MKNEPESKALLLYQTMLDRMARRTDRILGAILVLEWPVVLLCSWWKGADFAKALFLTGMTVLVPLIFILQFPGKNFTRHLLGAAHIMMFAFLFLLTQGKIETSFPIFILLVLLSFYRDWKVLLSASLLAVTESFLREGPWQGSHLAAGILLENLVLTFSCWQGQKELRKLGLQAAHLASLNSLVEKTIQERTEELQSIQERLLQSQKMEAIGNLAGGMAHDFNNVLGGILGYAGILRLEARGNQRLLDFIKVIESSAIRGADLTRKILTFARVGKFEQKEIRPEEVIMEAINLLNSTLDKQIAVQVHISPGLWKIMGDPTQVIQAIMNLGVNARDAMPDGGDLRVEASNQFLDSFHETGGGFPGPGAYVKISVADTGKGIPKDLQQKVFDPFFTTKERGKGTGLGLSMVYGTMQLHKGHVCLESEEGRGTVFNLFFPANSEKIAESASNADQGDAFRPARDRPERLKNRRILLVDDEEVLRDSTKELLERYGATVLTACSGEEAIRIFQEGPKEFDVVILDVIMPGMDGVTTFQHLYDIRAENIYLFSTGYTEHSRYMELLKRTDVPFIHKPYQGDFLVDQVDRIIQKPFGEKALKNHER